MVHVADAQVLSVETALSIRPHWEQQTCRFIEKAASAGAQVLSVDTALSIQSHPNKELAGRLHAERPEVRTRNQGPKGVSRSGCCVTGSSALASRPDRTAAFGGCTATFHCSVCIFGSCFELIIQGR